MPSARLRSRWWGTLILAGGLLVFSALPAAAQARRPVYVGAKVCAECHEGPSMGRQTTIWLRTKHARAYANLFRPEARAIAKISGVPIEPQKSPLCLGCHATAANAEDQDKDDTFSIRDGVQCEKCHGPGSEHADARAGTDPAAFVQARLEIPDSSECMKCHKDKPSHTNILKPSNAFDLAAALVAIGHPTPRGGKPASNPPPDPPKANAAGKLLGAAACAECHDAVEKGSQFSKWRLTKHADAYAVLGTPAGAKIAADMGIQGDPQASAQCLKCHTAAYSRPSAGAEESYSVLEGVGCESCHGPASVHVEAAGKADKAALLASLGKPTKASCLTCHENAHGKPFDYDAAWKTIAHPAVAPPPEKVVRYKTPWNLALRPDGKELFVTCEASYSVCVIDTASQKKVAEIAVGGQPMDVTFAPDGQRAYVTNRLDDSLSVIDVATRKVVATVPVGDEPHGVRTDRAGDTVYVLNTSSDDISVIDARSLREEKRLSASRSPWALALSPDGQRLVVTNALSRFVPFREPSISEVTVLDTARKVVDDRPILPAANLLQGVAWHPSGAFALTTLTAHKKSRADDAHGARLDDHQRPGRHLGRRPRGPGPARRAGPVLPRPDRPRHHPRRHSGSCHQRGHGLRGLRRSGPTAENAGGRHARRSRERHPQSSRQGERVRRRPRADRDQPPGDHDLGRQSARLRGLCARRRGHGHRHPRAQAIGKIDLGGPSEITQARRGERLFNSANIAFRRQLSCHTCHPDGHVDGLAYDIEADGIGVAPVDNRTLRGILDTGPFKWEGTNPSLARQCGPRLSVYFTRIQPFTPEELAALDHYISTIPRPPNRYRPLGAPLTPAQRRGKLMFERTRTNDGRIIPKDKRCITCHFPPLYTDRQLHDIGVKLKLDIHSKFDVPHLNNIYDSAPYLHNGIADTLEEIWTRYNPEDKHGVTNDMTKDQLNDLIEYLKTL